jgi:hypothetical protein
VWAFAVIAAALATLISFTPRQADDERTLAAAGARAFAESMAVYRAAVVEYARSNPHFDGPVNESQVATPAWWRGHPAMHSAVQGRLVAVYVTGPQAQGLMPEMLRVARDSIWVGFADRASGTLHSPTFGDTGIDLPDAVPDKAPVWLALRN